ncbi:hypothetical protein EVAR_66994_1 [Eumeta japonica]|uniref:Uncharacterized protein n=1 Tax=Eumeta variegata TaxID=151549 RepID=A0A4C1ZQM6_EUMVA|nr:hypothetical protein EVAR_66994_1 [Eumeta japonica]
MYGPFGITSTREVSGSANATRNRPRGRTLPHLAALYKVHGSSLDQERTRTKDKKLYVTETTQSFLSPSVSGKKAISALSSDDDTDSYHSDTTVKESDVGDDGFQEFGTKKSVKC